MANWQQISDAVYTDLSGYTDLINLLSDGVNSIYPLIAEAEELPPFITYHAEYEGKPSKDGVFTYGVTIRSFATSYNKAIAIADQVTEAIKNAGNIYIIQTGRPVFNDQDEFYIEQIFNIKK